MAKVYGVERLALLTNTFAEHITVLREADKRFESLQRNILSKRYVQGMVIPERHKSGRIHYHSVVVAASDIRSGCDFDAFERRDYRSANLALRSEWAFWRKVAPAYGFGRTELLPVKSTVQAIGYYVGKYVSKHVGQRSEFDKGSRLVRYWGYGPGERKFRPGFGWHTLGAWLWRHKLAKFAESVRAKNTDDLKRLFGPRWAWHFRKEIADTEIDLDFVPKGTVVSCIRFVNGKAVVDKLAARDDSNSVMEEMIELKVKPWRESQRKGFIYVQRETTEKVGYG